jgi:hypothetical protein
MTVNRRTKVNDMDKKPIFEAAYQVTGVTEFGSSFEELAKGKLVVPPEGVRVNIAFAGPITGDIEGTAEGIDYLYTRADGRMELNVRAVITTKDGKNISFEADGVSIGQPDGSMKFVENVKLFSSHPEYAKYNGLQIWGFGKGKGMEFGLKFYEAI